MRALFGIVLGFAVLSVAHLLEGGELIELINLPAAIIVLGGTFAAAFVQTPRSDFSRALQLLGWAFREESPDIRQTIDKVKGWCRSSRASGLVVLEREVARTEDPFARSALQLLADAQSPEMVRVVLETEIIRIENRDLQAARVIESMGGYAPTLGIIGAVLGLIQVMTNLNDPSVLGQGIATAFVATIYGVGSANLILLPLAQKMKRLIHGRSHYYELLMDGASAIAAGQTPGDVELRLQGYLEERRASPTSRG